MDVRGRVAPGAWLHRVLADLVRPVPLLGHGGVLRLHLPSGQGQSTQGALWRSGGGGGGRTEGWEEELQHLYLLLRQQEERLAGCGLLR